MKTQYNDKLQWAIEYLGENGSVSTFSTSKLYYKSHHLIFTVSNSPNKELAIWDMGHFVLATSILARTGSIETERKKKFFPSLSTQTTSWTTTVETATTAATSTRAAASAAAAN